MEIKEHSNGMRIIRKGCKN